MKVSFEASFARDLKRVKDRQLQQRIQEVISEVKVASTLGEIASIKKIQGHDAFFRVRLGDYRIGIEVIGDEVVFVRFLHRKEIYRYFP